jgi:hypothetical protein
MEFAEATSFHTFQADNASDHPAAAKKVSIKKRTTRDFGPSLG